MSLSFDSFLSMRQWVREVERRTGQTPKVIFADIEEVDAYYQLCLNEKRLVNTLKVEFPLTDAKGLDFMGIPIVEDKPEYRFTAEQLLRLIKQKPQ